MATIASFIRANGLVQGVGFRPTVFCIAREVGLTGEVFNDSEGVGIFLEGSQAQIERFEERLFSEKPPLARIDRWEKTPQQPRGFSDFVIRPSKSGTVKTAINPDASICEACLKDIFDRSNRRYRYAFTNCTHCGPRFSITKSLPYDRAATSMAPFKLCPDCLKEYQNPLDRRFHAQPNACPLCGPQLSLMNASGQTLSGDPLRGVAKALKEGKIVAIKGIGGFHLVCDAQNEAAVKRLRERKHRQEKALAIMVANTASLALFAEASQKEEALLTSVAHPIVLIKKKSSIELEGVAPFLAELGVMLPYTPLHWLIFYSLAGEPDDPLWFKSLSLKEALVMTSANLSREPIVKDNDEAFQKLASIADLFLMHNRDIVIKEDDSVLKLIDQKPILLRRARGFAPEAIPLAESIPSVLATGAYFKNTATLTRGHEAFMTPYIGDLDHPMVRDQLKAQIEHLSRLLEIHPKAVISDRHPDFFSTSLAQTLSQQWCVPHLQIQHHAAHVGAVMALSQRKETTLGLVLDGLGLGPNNDAWGGELLSVTSSGFSRSGHLKTLPLPGGDQAAREPWRMGVAILCALGRAHEINDRYGSIPFAQKLPLLMDNPRLAPPSSSMGRVFDGVASLLGIIDYQSDEATAPTRLEALASKTIGSVRHGTWSVEQGTLNLDPLLASLLERSIPRERHSADFHATLGVALADWIQKIGMTIPTFDGTIALSGGVMINRLLTEKLIETLIALGIKPLFAPLSMPADGSISLGQAWLGGLALASGQSQYRYYGENPLCV